MNPSELYKTTPPRLGHGVLEFFGLDRQYVNLNNGSYGSLPLPVLAQCNALTLEIERNPDVFHRRNYQNPLKRVREQVADIIGAHADECVIVPNASHGINTVLRNFDWESQDIIIAFNTTYGSIAKTIQHLSDTPPHPSIVEFTIQFPTTHADIISNFRDFVRQLPEPATGSPKRKVVAIIDSIISNPGALLPWQELVGICKKAGIWSMVDGAHSIGHEMNINLSTAQPDFWVSNCHKWLHAKRGCAVLYVPFRNQYMIKSAIPTAFEYVSPSSGEKPAFIQQFEWNGTIDFVPYLSVTYALEFRKWLGGEEKINEYCHRLAIEGGQLLANILGTSVMDPDGSFTANMVNVELPLSSSVRPSMEVTIRMNEKLLEQHNVYSAHFFHNELGKSLAHSVPGDGTGGWVECAGKTLNDHETE
ncbi:hypothetical protein HGRIS_005283 [Hohenbuehelia grisea]|uniref:Aminotransferase class V domain-containing protein n=1 Tax=Hohenbuehelia grisea TaxID=104357 RepID=A0ABR3JG20_9AGAR